MRRSARFVGALALAASVLGLGATSDAATMPAHAAAPSAEDDPITRLGSCLEAGGQGDVLLVFDTSGSLSKSSNGNPPSDPDAARVEAASYLVDQLAAYVERVDVSIDVATAGFAVDFSGPTEWTDLTSSSTDQVKDEIADYADQDQGFETDYWAAANGAREALGARDEGETRRCQAWVWFSDGQLDLDQRDSASEVEEYGDTKPYGPRDLRLTSKGAEEQLEQSAKAGLCAEGGIADALRAQNIITIGLGLAGADSTSTPDFSTMQGVATGSDGCGRKPKQVPGLFVPVASVTDLYLAFDRLADPSTPPLHQDTPVCQGTVCAEGTQTFVLDESIGRVDLLAGSDVRGYQAVLIDPQGQQEMLQPQDDRTITFKGATGSVRWVNGQVVSISLLNGEGEDGWTGQWKIAFVDPTKSSQDMTAGTNLRLFGDLVPYLVDAGKPVAGETTQIIVGLKRRGGEAVGDPERDIKGEVSFDLALVYLDGTPVGELTDLGKSDLGKPLDLDLMSATPGQASIRLSLDVTTADAKVAGQERTIPGTRLQRREVQEDVTLLAPPSFPVVTTAVDFGSTDEVGAISASLPVEDKGCVWLEPKSLQVESAPEGIKTPVTSSADSEADCVTGDLPLEISVTDLANGGVLGTFSVITRADGGAAGSKTIPVQVHYQLEVTFPRDTETFIVALVLITIIGILIPILLLYLVKWRTSQIAGNSLTLVSVSGQVDAGRSFLTQAQPREQDGRVVTLEGNRRLLPLSGRAKLLSRTGIGLTEPGYCVVDGVVSASSTNPFTTRNGLRARLPLAPQDTWVVLLDPANPGGSVEVLFLLSPTSGQLANLLTDARSRAPQAVAKLREKLGSGSTPDSSPPGDSGGWGGGGGTPSSPPAPAPAAGSWGGSDDGWGSPSTAPPTTPGGGPGGW